MQGLRACTVWVYLLFLDSVSDRNPVEDMTNIDPERALRLVDHVEFAKYVRLGLQEDGFPTQPQNPTLEYPCLKQQHEASPGAEDGAEPETSDHEVGTWALAHRGLALNCDLGCRPTKNMGRASKT